jgi:hypothetical protein
VTFSFERYARKDVPMNPKILRTRHDITWAEVVQSSFTETLPNQSGMWGMQVMNEGGKERRHVFAMKPQKHWTDSTMRAFFETYAKSQGLDPLVPETWYPMSRNTIYTQTVCVSFYFTSFLFF